MRSGRQLGHALRRAPDKVQHRRNTRSSAVPRGSPRANRRLKRDAMSDANGSPPRAMEEDDDDRRPQRSPREGSPERKVRRRSSRRERRRTDAPRGHLEPLDAVIPQPAVPVLKGFALELKARGRLAWGWCRRQAAGRLARPPFS